MDFFRKFRSPDVSKTVVTPKVKNPNPKGKYRVTRELLDALAEKRIYTTVNKTEKSWLTVGRTVGFNGSVYAEPYSAVRAGPRFFSIGAFSYSRSCFPDDVVVKRYAAIGPGISVMGIDHPMERLSMVGFDYSKRKIFETARKDFKSNQKIIPLPDRKRTGLVIGNDVWIGEDVLLARGITIGDGAVIAARSIVTKDVPSYAVMAGSPARVKKYRFPEQLIERLKISQWWDYNFTSFEGMDTTKAEIFMDQFEEVLQGSGIEPWVPKRVSMNRMFAKFADPVS